jgi:hypothetical protein
MVEKVDGQGNQMKNETRSLFPDARHEWGPMVRKSVSPEEWLELCQRCEHGEVAIEAWDMVTNADRKVSYREKRKTPTP